MTGADQDKEIKCVHVSAQLVSLPNVSLWDETFLENPAVVLSLGHGAAGHDVLTLLLLRLVLKHLPKRISSLARFPFVTQPERSPPQLHL